jgi:hypothetical protein
MSGSRSKKSGGQYDKPADKLVDPESIGGKVRENRKKKKKRLDEIMSGKAD